MDKVLRDASTAFRIRIGGLGSREPGRILFENEFFGQVGTVVSVSAISSAEALGLPTIAATYLVTASGITSGETFGAPVVSLAGSGAQTVSPSGIAGVETLGSLSLLATYLLTPAGIAGAEAFGSPVVKSNLSLVVIGISSAEAAGAHAVTTSYVVTATGIVSAEGLGAAQVKASYVISPSAIASIEALPGPSVLSVYRVQPSGIGSGSAVGTPSLGGALNLGVPYIEAMATAQVDVSAALEMMAARQVLLAVFQELEAIVSAQAAVEATGQLEQPLQASAAAYSEGLAMADITRGSTVTFKATFKDPAGVTVTPSQAAVFVSFPSSDGSRQTTELAMTNNAGEWSANWDTGHARAGTVHWSAQTKGTTPAAAVDGSFELVANAANPENND